MRYVSAFYKLHFISLRMSLITSMRIQLNPFLCVEKSSAEKSSFCGDESPHFYDLLIARRRALSKCGATYIFGHMLHVLNGKVQGKGKPLPTSKNPRKKPIHLPIHPAVCFLFIIMMKGATALAQQIQPTRSTTANEPDPSPFSSRRGWAQIVCVTSEMSKPKDKSGLLSWRNAS